MTSSRRPIRIGNSSGAIGDGPDQLYRLATEGPLDAIFSDYLAEVNIPWRALEMMDRPELGYEQSPLIQLRWATAAEEIAKRGIKWVHDGGALNPRALYEEIKKELKTKGLLGQIKMAWVEGDNVIGPVKASLNGEGKVFPHLDIPGQTLNDAFKSKEEVAKIVSANAYMGMRGILAALQDGAQIIICGRVCDASPVMALGAWWHGWSLTDWDELAGSLVAGHITECGAYTTGGNFCDFPSIFPNPGSESSKFFDLGYPVLELSHDGSSIITMHPGSNGAVTADTVTAQLVYEIQGPKYLNPDVVANLEGVHVEDVPGEKNRVKVWGIKGSPPPPTTKLAVCSLAGYQAESTLFAVGLNIKEKYESWKMQVMRKIDPSKFTKIAIDLYGYGLHSLPATAESGSRSFDPNSEKECTAMIRHFVQAPTKEVISQFSNMFLTQGMAGYPGLTGSLDFRSGVPKPYIKFFPAIIPQMEISMRVHIGTEIKDDNKSSGKVESGWHEHTIDIPPIQEKHTEAFNGQISYDPEDREDLTSFGSTKRVPLGTLVLARSGDKGGNANVGFWVRDANSEAWPWLRSLLTIEKVRELLGRDAYPAGANSQPHPITRFEMPHIRAVHFVIFGILEDGVSSSSLVDPLGKSVGEYLRAREVEIPERFVMRQEQHSLSRM